MMIDRILILSASAGAGHVKAGQSLLTALRDNSRVKEVLHVDALDYATATLRWLYARGYVHCVRHAPTLFRKLYDVLDKPLEIDSSRVNSDLLQANKLMRLVRDFSADAILATHFFPAAVVSSLKKRQLISSYLGVVVTDCDVHVTWLVANCDQYYVASEFTAQYLGCLGYGDLTSVTGIPVSPVYAVPKDRRQLQQKYNLHPDLPTVLVSSGAFCLVPIEHTIKELLSAQPSLQVLALCGKNQELQRRIERLELTGANSNSIDAYRRLHVFGYVDQMDELMACSDVIVSKPGGLTVSEALARGVIFAIVNPIPGQEERNADFLLENGAAIRCNSELSLATRIVSLLADQDRCAAMRQNIARLARPRAAQDIANSVIGALDGPNDSKI